MVLPYRFPFRALILGGLLGLSILGACYAAGLYEPLRIATRWTGRMSALLFIPIFVARPLVTLLGNGRAGKLLRHRAGLGLVLAGNHHVHMVLLFILLTGEGATWVDFLSNPGLYIYGLLIVMNVTSFPAIARTLPRQVVRWLHRVGIYALAGAFFSTLTLSIITGEEDGLFRYCYSIVFVLCLLIRLLADLSERMHRRET